MEHTDNYQFCRPYILPGETILWKGHPEKGNLFTSRDAVLIPFSLFICAFSFFWEYTALQSSLFFAIWGLPIVVISLYMLVGRYIQAAYLRNKTAYIITDKKIIIKKGRKITMHDGRDLPPMEVEIHRNGNGTILFYEEIYTRRGRRHNTYIMLENLADVAQAQNAVSMMDK